MISVCCPATRGDVSQEPAAPVFEDSSRWLWNVHTSLYNDVPQDNHLDNHLYDDVRLAYSSFLSAPYLSVCDICKDKHVSRRPVQSRKRSNYGPNNRACWTLKCTHETPPQTKQGWRKKILSPKRTRTSWDEELTASHLQTASLEVTVAMLCKITTHMNPCGFADTYQCFRTAYPRRSECDAEQIRWQMTTFFNDILRPLLSFLP